MKDEFVRKLKERYEKGEISKETYEEILQRYKEEKEEKEEDDENKEAEYEDRGKDYKCAGMCTVPGGRYEYISASGTVKITGEIHAKKVSSGGMLTASSSIYTEVFNSGGTASIEGDLVAGSISSGGILKARRIEGGRVKTGGVVKCTELKCENGEIGGKVKAEKIQCKKLKIYLSASCKVDEIIGGDVEIRAKKGILRKYAGTMKSNKIRGENVCIESTSAEEVEGDSVEIGEGCVIGIVKGKNIKISNKAKVGKVVKK